MGRVLPSFTDLEVASEGILSDISAPTLLNQDKLRESLIDDLIYTAEFATDPTLTAACTGLIYSLSELTNCASTSIYSLYQAFGKGDIKGFTVPAVNIRALTYDTARLIFRIMQKYEIGSVIFEIARSEIEYTNQRPQQFAVAVLAAAIKEGYQGPVFLQGDHYQFSKNKFSIDKEQEIQRIKSLIDESIKAKFYNIDIDASTLVDLSQNTLASQQQLNSEMTALLTTYIREHEPEGVTISIGGEIGHIGGKNSTVADFDAFMKGYQAHISTNGITKVSVQTGSTHGGTPLPNGTIQQVQLDFSVLKEISTHARKEYQLGGAVQHGASTLPLSDFDHFVDNDTLEIHLATGLQNIVYETMPQLLKESMYNWIQENLQKERDPDWTEEQFLYKTRKKALGPFKQKLWNLSQEEKDPIIAKLSDQLTTIFQKLQIFSTVKTIDTYVNQTA